MTIIQNARSGSETELDFLTPRQKRRLDPTSRMVLSVLHALLPVEEDALLFYASASGAQDLQLALQSQFHQEGEIHPATFSVSVFNGPIGQATVLLHLPLPYTALSVSDHKVGPAFTLARSTLMAGRAKTVVLLIAEGPVPDLYKPLAPEEDLEPFALGFKLALDGEGRRVPEVWYGQDFTEDDLLEAMQA